MSLIFSNLVVIKILSPNHRMYNLYTKFVKILEICKQFSENLVNESGNVPRRGPVPKFSDLEVVALSLTAEAESIDSEKWLFDYKLQEYKDSIPNLISRRQFNDRNRSPSLSELLCDTFADAMCTACHYSYLIFIFHFFVHFISRSRCLMAASG